MARSRSLHARGHRSNTRACFARTCLRDLPPGHSHGFSSAQLRYGHEFVSAITDRIKALVSAFDIAVKADVKAHGLNKLADESESVYQIWYADRLRLVSPSPGPAREAGRPRL